MASDIRHFIEQLGPGDHVGCLYRDQTDLEELVAQFVRFGIDRSEKVLCVGDPRAPGAVARYLHAAGVDVTSLVVSGQLSMVPLSTFLSETGRLNPERLADLLVVETKHTRREGLTALRVTVDMSWMLEQDDVFEDLLACEERLDEIAGQYGCIVLCQYAQHSYDELASILAAHPVLIVNGQVWVPPYDGRSSRTTVDADRPRSEGAGLTHTSERTRAHPYSSLYQRVFETMAEAVAVYEMVLDEDGVPIDYRVLEVNPAFEAQMEISRDEALGQLITRIMAAPEAPHLDRYKRVVIEGQADRFRVHHEQLEKDFEILVFALDERRFVTVIEDITERVLAESALRQSQKRFAKAEEVAHIGSWEMDIATGRSIWSDEFFRICGFEPGAFEPSAEHGMSIIHPEDRDRAAEAIQRAVEEGGFYDIEKRVVRPDGEVRYVHSVGEIQRDESGKSVKVIGSFLDITDRVMAEKEVAQFTKALIRSNEELERYAHVISHDLREPVRAISGFLDLLSSRYQDELPPKAQTYVSYALEGASRVREMIRVLVDLSRVDAEGRPMKRTDTEEVLLHVLSDLSVAIEEAGAEIVWGDLPEVVADRVQLRQVFANLISNAVKFRRSGVEPRVEISAERRKDAWVFEVRDNGIGIDLSQRDRLFRVFQRLHSESEYPGLGVGLALCKRIVTRHGGRIWAESTLGEGTTLYFSIPDPVPVPGYRGAMEI